MRRDFLFGKKEVIVLTAESKIYTIGDFVHLKQNPGDPRVPEGVEMKPRLKVYVLGHNGAGIIARDEYDSVEPLFTNGVQPASEEEEALELEITTFTNMTPNGNGVI